jgi:hypothetical protein
VSALLPDGRVLVAGGFDVAAAGLYDPTRSAFSDAGVLALPRERATATVQLDGRVFIAGGFLSNTGDMTASTEVFDPETETFTPATPMAAARGGHTATRLDDGRILLAGVANFIEIVDPSGGPTEFELAFGRGYHTATRIAGGRVLLAGGQNGGDGLRLAELFEPGVGLREVGSLLQGRTNHTAVLLADGRVLLAGGADSWTYDDALDGRALGPALETFAAANSSRSLASARTRRSC